MLSVDEAEIRDLKWWCKHHEKNIQHLLHLIEMSLAGEDVKGIMQGSLKGYRKTYPKE